MNELNKLIEQYWKSKGYPSELLDDFEDGLKDIFENKSGRWRNDIIGLLEFTTSRPTCKPDYLFDTVEDWEETCNLVANESFKIGFSVARATFKNIVINGE